jgi:hypothetical protein
VIAAEDDAVGAHLSAETERLAFATDRLIIDPREEWEPVRDAIVVCGPASGHIGHKLMEEDPRIGMGIQDGPTWYITDKATGTRYSSPMDDADQPRRADHAYIARHVDGGRVTVHIAGLHALGSIGAAHYLTEHLPELWSEFGDHSFSMAVTGEFTGLTPTNLSILIPARAWEE